MSDARRGRGMLAAVNGPGGLFARQEDKAFVAALIDADDEAGCYLRALGFAGGAGAMSANRSDVVGAGR